MSNSYVVFGQRQLHALKQKYPFARMKDDKTITHNDALGI